MATTSTSIARRNITLLFKPSWISAMLCVLASLAVVIGGIVFAHYRGSQIQQQFLIWRTTAATSSYATAVSAEYESKGVQDTTSEVLTFIFWLFVGLIAYLIVYGIYQMFYSAHELGGEFKYTHVSQRRLLLDILLRIGTRLAALAVWFMYILLFFHDLLPRTLAAGQVAAVHIVSLQGLELALGSCVALLFGLHLHVILFRLVLLRPRL